MAFRPALLPEDLRFIGLSTAEVSAIGPRLSPWLTQVFRVLGGYALATGVLTVALSATAFRARQLIAVAGAAIAGICSIGLMVAINFAIDSDFKWPLLVPAAIWLLSIAALYLEARTPSSRTQVNDRKGN